MLSCQDEQERMPASVSAEDSAAFMRSRGISTLISDSGILRYKLVAEELDRYTNTNASTW
jgi:lipopolysaccharide export system protein LptC